MTLTAIGCARCGESVAPDAWAQHVLLCRPRLEDDLRETEARDARLAAAVKAGTLPGKVPDHYARDWSPN